MDYFLDNYCHTTEFCNENCRDYILDVQSTMMVYFILFLIFYWTVELYFNSNKNKEPLKVEFLIKVKDDEYEADEESDESEYESDYEEEASAADHQSDKSDTDTDSCTQADECRWVRNTNNRLSRRVRSGSKLPTDQYLKELAKRY